MREQQRDWAYFTLQERHIALLERLVESQDWPGTKVAQAVVVTQEDHWVHETILALEVSCVLPETQPCPCF